MKWFLSILFLSPFPITAQTSLRVINEKAQIDHNLTCGIETVGMTGGGDFAPFWLTSNHQGLPSVESNNCYSHLATLGDIFMPNGLAMYYGCDIGIGVNSETNFFVHQLYCDFGYKWFGLEAGMKERCGDKISMLSSGSLTWSGNCQPLPEIRAGIPNYTRVPILGNLFSIKGHIGYGRMTDDKWRKGHGGGYYVEGILFHSKSAFVRFGDENRFPLQVTLGLEMNNMFGGTRYNGDIETDMPSDLAAYWTVLFPFHHLEQQGSKDGDNLGSWHLIFDYKIKDWHIGAYYEHFYEDHSSMLGIEYKNNTQGEKGFIFYGFRQNWFDGLFGIEINAPNDVKIFHNAVFEFLNTRGQCGSMRLSNASYGKGQYVTEEVDGRDDMYNHTIYKSYSHWGYAIGSPVIISPIYNNDGTDRFRSNRVRMFHIGIDGSITKQIDYRMLATTTKHWGRYTAPLKEVERVSSVMLECSYRLGGASLGWKISLSGAMDFDSGDLLGNNRGVMLTISRQWQIM